MEYKTLRTEINNSMKAKDEARLSALRLVLGEVDLAVINDKNKSEAAEADVDAALKKTLKQTKETLEASEKAGNDAERTARLAAQVAVLEEYLPEQLEGEKLEQRIDAIIA